MDRLPDEELLLCFRSGNEQAFSTLVQRYLPMLKGEVAHFCGQTLEAEDLSQEALLGLLAAAKTYRTDGGAAFSTYARTCVRRKLIDAVRRVAKQDGQEDPAWTLSSIEEADPADLFFSKEETKAFEKRLRAVLTNLEYQVLMRYLSASSHDEIARSLGVSRKSVDNALWRAKRKLATAFMTV
ncbi:MAG: sigma-70 family RNA polymerase sigma factor [Clostridia bacterium]|nr:sigma-70 family RNA polymerase sigma factor [Clostridia bacterium]